MKIDFYHFEEKYNKNKDGKGSSINDWFEFFSSCHFNLKHNVDSPSGFKNHPALEQNPITVDDKIKGFQSKYITSENNNHIVKVFKEAIKEVNNKYPKLNELYLYTNYDWYSGNQEFYKSKKQKTIEDEFENLEIFWVNSVGLEDDFVKPEYNYIYNIFFNKENRDYEILKDEEKNIYKEIENKIDRNEDLKKILNFEKINIIHGISGIGKTSIISNVIKHPSIEKDLNIAFPIEVLTQPSLSEGFKFWQLKNNPVTFFEETNSRNKNKINIFIESIEKIFYTDTKAFLELLDIIEKYDFRLFLTCATNKKEDLIKLMDQEKINLTEIKNLDPKALKIPDNIEENLEKLLTIPFYYNLFIQNKKNRDIETISGFYEQIFQRITGSNDLIYDFLMYELIETLYQKQEIKYNEIKNKEKVDTLIKNSFLNYHKNSGVVKFSHDIFEEIVFFKFFDINKEKLLKYEDISYYGFLSLEKWLLKKEENERKKIIINLLLENQSTIIFDRIINFLKRDNALLPIIIEKEIIRNINLFIRLIKSLTIRNGIQFFDRMKGLTKEEYEYIAKHLLKINKSHVFDEQIFLFLVFIYNSTKQVENESNDIFLPQLEIEIFKNKTLSFQKRKFLLHLILKKPRLNSKIIKELFSPENEEHELLFETISGKYLDEFFKIYDKEIKNIIKKNYKKEIEIITKDIEHKEIDYKDTTFIRIFNNLVSCSDNDTFSDVLIYIINEFIKQIYHKKNIRTTLINVAESQIIHHNEIWYSEETCTVPLVKNLFQRLYSYYVSRREFLEQNFHDILKKSENTGIYSVIYDISVSFDIIEIQKYIESLKIVKKRKAKISEDFMKISRPIYDIQEIENNKTFNNHIKKINCEIGIIEYIKENIKEDDSLHKTSKKYLENFFINKKNKKDIIEKSFNHQPNHNWVFIQYVDYIIEVEFKEEYSTILNYISTNNDEKLIKDLIGKLFKKLDKDFMKYFNCVKNFTEIKNIDFEHVNDFKDKLNLILNSEFKYFNSYKKEKIKEIIELIDKIDELKEIVIEKNYHLNLFNELLSFYDHFYNIDEFILIYKEKNKKSKITKESLSELQVILEMKRHEITIIEETLEMLNNINDPSLNQIIIEFEKKLNE